MPIPKINAQVTSSNYYSPDGNNENLTMLAASTALNKNTTLTFGFGNDWTVADGKNKNKPAIEAKVKYNIGKNLNTQFRFREIGNTEQYRVTFGGSHKINKNQSLYASVHTTAKNSDSWKYNAGGWIGYTYKFNSGTSVSAEFQQNIPLNNTKQSVGKILSSFDDSNKMLNVIFSIPLN